MPVPARRRLRQPDPCIRRRQSRLQGILHDIVPRHRAPLGRWRIERIVSEPRVRPCLLLPHHLRLRVRPARIASRIVLVAVESVSYTHLDVYKRQRQHGICTAAQTLDHTRSHPTAGSVPAALAPSTRPASARAFPPPPADIASRSAGSGSLPQAPGAW